MARRSSIAIEITSPTTCVISLRGAHDASSRLGVTLTLAIAGGYRNVLVDLGECVVGDASLAASLQLAATRMREHDGALELVVPESATALRSALERAGLERLLPFHETRAAGRASIGAAEQLGSHRDGRSLTSVSARIVELEARTQSGRARELLRSRPGVTLVSAQITPALARSAEDDGARRAA